MTYLLAEEFWERASCRGQDPLLWVVEKPHSPTISERNIRGMEMCASCPILDKCRTFASEQPENLMMETIWAGRRWDIAYSCKSCGSTGDQVRIYRDGYCSPRCRIRANVPPPLKRNRAPAGTLSRMCKHCGGEFGVARGSSRAWCSNKCKMEAQHAEAEPRLCAGGCGQTFPYIAQYRDRKYCSPRCRSITNSQNRRDREQNS